MIAAALAHVALTKCKWHHPSNCRQKGSRGQLSGRRLQDRLKPNYPFVSSGRSINPTRVNVLRARAREGKHRERDSAAISHVDPHLFETPREPARKPGGSSPKSSRSLTRSPNAAAEAALVLPQSHGDLSSHEIQRIVECRRIKTRAGLDVTRLPSTTSITNV